VETEQSNTTSLVGADYVVKVYRRLESGINPEIEMGRFLTEATDFTNTPALLGSVELIESKRHSAVAVVHAFVQNQGDAWTFTAGYLDRFAEEHRLLPPDAGADEPAEPVPYALYMLQTGKRLAEMHMALASRDDIDEFRAERASAADASGWIETV